jgi:DNA-binding response OmpR family regulator
MPDGRLLILDDDPMVGQILSMASKSAGFEARWCEAPEAFFAAATEWQPTHVAVDLLMPDISGLDVLRRLAERGCRAAVIISSGLGAGELQDALDEARALGLPTAGVLPKPFSLASVRALLKPAG